MDDHFAPLLFIHETGRILMGITAFLLILIAVSGIFLVAQRQNGWKNFFSNVEKPVLPNITMWYSAACLYSLSWPLRSLAPT
ncbi:PepSY domain-containing protein [Niabella sp. W65]|nr:PepSY domain-containing protein [Niabella sp. W65]MCH7361379.1 PepSY domain-containing protein [Niabella sp. W65]